MDGYRKSNKNAVIYFLAGKMVRILIGLSLGLLLMISHLDAAQDKPVVFTKDLSFDDLPAGIEKRLPTGASNAEVAAILRKQPAIVLDGAMLVITPPPIGSNRTLATRTIELRNGARIVTNGVNFELDTLQISSDRGAILSFSDQPKARNETPSGTSGRSGQSGGTLILNGALNGNEVLTVSLMGQDGENGGTGFPGAAGAPGPRGEDGADHLVDCAHGAGNGGNGARGGGGGTGADGGAGGNGGRLILRGRLQSQRLQIEFTAPGGKGGSGGAGGPGGSGGPGGQGGSGTTFCRGGSPGLPGQIGPTGAAGTNGINGHDGSISAD